MRDEFRAGKLVESIQAGLAAGADVNVVVQGITRAIRVVTATIEGGIVTFRVDKTHRMEIPATSLLAVIFDDPD